VTISTNTILGGAGSIGGATTVQSGGIVQAVSGPLTISKLSFGDNASAVTFSRFALAAGGKISTGTLNVFGTNFINILDGSLPVGTNTLITYTSVIGGGGFTGFKLGTLPALPTGTAAYLKNSGAAVQLAVVPLVPPVLVGTATFTDGTIAFDFSGAEGQSYRVLTSTEMTIPSSNWQVLASGIFGSSAVQFADEAATNAHQFYRIVSP
jgi:hypothetical protein